MILIYISFSLEKNLYLDLFASNATPEKWAILLALVTNIGKQLLYLWYNIKKGFALWLPLICVFALSILASLSVISKSLNAPELDRLIEESIAEQRQNKDDRLTSLSAAYNEKQLMLDKEFKQEVALINAELSEDIKKAQKAFNSQKQCKNGYVCNFKGQGYYEAKEALDNLSAQRKTRFNEAQKTLKDSREGLKKWYEDEQKSIATPKTKEQIREQLLEGGKANNQKISALLDVLKNIGIFLSYQAVVFVVTMLIAVFLELYSLQAYGLIIHLGTKHDDKGECVA